MSAKVASTSAKDATTRPKDATIKGKLLKAIVKGGFVVGWHSRHCVLLTEEEGRLRLDWWKNESEEAAGKEPKGKLRVRSCFIDKTQSPAIITISDAMTREPVSALVERFDIEPFSDFSAK